MRHPNVLSLLVLLPLLSAAAAAQPAPDPPARAGDRALLFSVDGLSLGAFDGGFGMKWWAGDAHALWTGVRLAVAGEAAEGEAERRYDGQNASVTVGVEFHSRAPRRLSPFVSVEGGAGVSRYRVRDGRGLLPGAPAPTGGFTRLSLEGGVGLGAEVRVLDWLSLSGSQRLVGQVYRRTELRPFAEDETATGFALRDGGARLTLAVYF